MAESGRISQDDFAILVATVQVTLDSLEDWLKPVDIRSSITTEGAKLNALDLAYDTASIIRAQSTKLYLLTHKKFFPPSAPTKVLQELISGPIPSLVFIAELCDPKIYTQTMSQELDYRLNRLVAELITLVRAIPLDRELVCGSGENSLVRGEGEVTQFMVGTIYEACDALMELRQLGVAGLFARKAEEYRDLLQDALEELCEWGKEHSDVEDEGQSSCGSDKCTEQAVESHIFAPQKHIPDDDPDKIRPRLEATMKLLRLLILMFRAIIKRRFETLSGIPKIQLESGSENRDTDELKIVESLDHVLEAMKRISDITDDLASSFYELDLQQIDLRMNECFTTGSNTPQLLVKNWEGKEDGFTSWVRGVKHSQLRF